MSSKPGAIHLDAVVKLLEELGLAGLSVRLH